MAEKENKLMDKLVWPLIVAVIGGLILLFFEYGLCIFVDCREPFPLSGRWEGEISSLDETFSTFLVMDIDDTCDLGTICGDFDTPDLSCKGDLELARQSGNHYYFLEVNITGNGDCLTGIVQRLSLQNGSLYYEGGFSPTEFEVHTTGNLFQQ